MLVQTGVFLIKPKCMHLLKIHQGSKIKYKCFKLKNNVFAPNML